MKLGAIIRNRSVPIHIGGFLLRIRLYVSCMLCALSFVLR